MAQPYRGMESKNKSNSFIYHPQSTRLKTSFSDKMPERPQSSRLGSEYSFDGSHNSTRDPLVSILSRSDRARGLLGSTSVGHNKPSTEGYLAYRQSKNHGNRFTPDRFETRSNRPSVVAKNMSPRAALKAGGLKIAADDIKSILNALKPFINTQITALPEKIKNKFNRLAVYVQTLYNTDDYETLYSWVKDNYGHLSSVYPGTVGSYMAGCMVRTSLSDTEAGCAISCAASIPPPMDDKTFNHCSNTVIMGNYDDNKYHFTIYRKAEEPEYHHDAYLYINSSDPQNYPGFNEVEKKQLIEYGVEKVKLYGFNSDGRNYINLTNNLVPVSNLKSRNRHHSEYNDHRHHHSKPYQKPHSSGSNSWWIIIVIVVIVIILFIGWMFYRSTNKNQGYNIINSGSMNYTQATNLNSPPDISVQGITTTGNKPDVTSVSSGPF